MLPVCLKQWGYNSEWVAEGRGACLIWFWCAEVKLGECSISAMRDTEQRISKGNWLLHYCKLITILNTLEIHVFCSVHQALMENVHTCTGLWVTQSKSTVPGNRRHRWTVALLTCYTSSCANMTCVCSLSAQLWVRGVFGPAAEERSQPKLPGHLWLHSSAPRCQERVRASCCL